ncbi:hypothetical protein FD41_GL002726 [Lentilactobacillus farraginis DSM 18382 = JCM 14108]|uniref:Uncharacterized protein n=1 Tax=Lentilactobacillus farraginis DSM 18382 = JCM 14108 TaxID=1423743 RepID=A0A0R1VU04_9LACO|nr:hypothetical protein FD41_GL002726 [Lentilactobacillus farraginis DSM 18382 = JCM 14108]
MAYFSNASMTGISSLWKHFYLKQIKRYDEFYSNCIKKYIDNSNIVPVYLAY